MGGVGREGGVVVGRGEGCAAVEEAEEDILFFCFCCVVDVVLLGVGDG